MAAPAQAMLSDRDVKIYREAFNLADKDKWDDAKRVARMAEDKLPGKVLQWLDLKRVGSGASFDTLSRFIRENPDWPDQLTLRRQAESAMPDDMPDDQVRVWFKDRSPLTLPAFFRHVDALMTGDQDAKAHQLVRERWVEGSFGPIEEQDFRVRFASLLTRDDHVGRLERLLWDGQDAAARRLFPLVGDDWKALAEARMALAEEARNAEALLARVPSDLRDNPGLVYERLRWRRRADQDDAALEILDRQPKKLDRPELWWNERNILVRRAIEKADYAQAYRLAKNHGLPDGKGLADAEFLAGWLALRFLDKPAAALAH
ncbi:MAG TPA: lytic transglycosylase domain-containing protein, partial [Azospirillaceae bacterium]|nr:lytic transglycosylase domain-containing protein [Azospirillaceae bacterium]